MNEAIAKQLALGIAALCVRNTSLENLHAGVVPHSLAGDYSDVYLTTPSGKIPWNELSRINNDEMKTLMIEVVNNIYTILLRLDDPAFLGQFEKLTRQYTAGWNEPDFLKDWLNRPIQG